MFNWRDFILASELLIGFAFSVLLTAVLMKKNGMDKRNVKVLAATALLCSAIGVGCLIGVLIEAPFCSACRHLITYSYCENCGMVVDFNSICPSCKTERNIPYCENCGRLIKLEG